MIIRRRLNLKGNSVADKAVCFVAEVLGWCISVVLVYAVGLGLLSCAGMLGLI